MPAESGYSAIIDLPAMNPVNSRMPWPTTPTGSSNNRAPSTRQSSNDNNSEASSPPAPTVPSGSSRFTRPAATNGISKPRRGRLSTRAQIAINDSCRPAWDTTSFSSNLSVK